MALPAEASTRPHSHVYFFLLAPSSLSHEKGKKNSGQTATGNICHSATVRGYHFDSTKTRSENLLNALEERRLSKPSQLTI